MDTGSSAETALPDLGFAPLRDLRIDKTVEGRKLLRFTSEIVNVGTAPFEVRGQRPDMGSPMMTAQQYVGGAPVGSTFNLIFGGDGHNHWHVQRLARYNLETLGGKSLKTGAKLGFCFWDTHAYRSGAPPVTYSSSGCGTTDSVSVTMGLTPGWGDIYPWSLPDQWIDVTGLAKGKYRLWARVNTAGGFVEATSANNTIWMDLKIAGTKVVVLATGPAA